MKCDLCKQKVEETFLKKMFGTYVKIGKKQKLICSRCQSQKPMEEIRKQIS
tara:strand:+ start:558 stop:710 length:153 start_codon:yes stop_codon:yes gene_type:complete